MNIPRPEHPDPQRFRDAWVNLNGPWDFAVDAGRNGLAAGWLAARNWPAQRTISVPFCPESKLSGVKIKDFMPAVWYRRTFQVPTDWKGKRVRLHFGAVDFDCRVWVNGQAMGRHIGGYTPFWFDITDALKAGDNEVVVYAEDDVRTGRQPSGKQSGQYDSYGCMYTRVTGIWQTVWLEAVGQAFVQEVQVVASDNLRQVSVLTEINGQTGDMTLHAEAFLAGKSVGVWQGPAGALTAANLALTQVEAWDVGKGTLYDLVLEVRDRGGKTVDRSQSYFGLRKVEVRNRRFTLTTGPCSCGRCWTRASGPTASTRRPPMRNSRPTSSVLWPAASTAPACTRRSSSRGRSTGRTGWATCWLARWPTGAWMTTTPSRHDAFVADWTAAVRRDRNRPSVILWTPFNETHGRRAHTWDKDRHDGLLRMIYNLTKHLDPTRPVIDTVRLRTCRYRYL